MPRAFTAVKVTSPLTLATLMSPSLAAFSTVTSPDTVLADSSCAAEVTFTSPLTLSAVSAPSMAASLRSPETTARSHPRRGAR